MHLSSDILFFSLRSETLYYAVNIQAVFGKLEAYKLFDMILEKEFITDNLSPENFQALSIDLPSPSLMTY